MPNGNVGDHPLTDILVHHRRVYSAQIDELIREIAQLSDDGDRRALGDMLLDEYNEFSNPDLAKLEGVLTRLLEVRRKDATSRGWES